VTEEMTAYYARRAAEYERVYAGPRWQDDLAVLRPRVADFAADRLVLEVACGTGFWTERAAERARAVHATDLNEDTLALARSKTYAAPVTFERRDAYAPAAPEAPPRFDAGLAGLWLSHVDLARMDEFLRAFHSHLAPGARVLMFDERATEERPNPPASRTDRAGNRYEMRRLLDGERFEILKNLFDGARLEALVRPHAATVHCRALRYFWLLEYALP
jgi:demethylmenaquinone methyltransferase/2-methoxy-6-polyprenyl-1,4-benzoquinol methylase